MKKSIIAAGAASVALAAMPIVSTFAVTSVKDNLTATVTSGCSASDSEISKDVKLAVAPGNTAESTPAGSISIVCTGVAWNVTAVGSTSETAAESNKLVEVDSEGEPVAEGEFIAPYGTASASTWGYKVTSATDANITIVEAKKAWHAVPQAGNAEIIASGSAATPVSGTIYTQYQINTLLSQKAADYAGQVTYTVAAV